MPHMADPNFAQTLTYIVEHNANGAMGLVVNRPQELNLADILEQLRPDEEPPASTLQVPIYQADRCRPTVVSCCTATNAASRPPSRWKGCR